MNIPVTDLAHVDQQLEQHAQNIERVQRDAVYEIGRELAAAQELHKYQRATGGFTGWLADRLPHLSQTTAYRCIDVFQNIDPSMFPTVGNIPAGVLEQVAKAEPDVQALIADRIATGEIFTASKVKELREEITGLKAAIKRRDDEVKEFENSLPTPKEAEKQAAETSGGVVLGSDMKYHSGAAPEQKALTADYMTGWSILKEFSRDDFPLPGRVAAGCPAKFRRQLAGFCAAASTYVEQLREALDAANDD